jgi:hypothetical protein
MNNIFAKLLLSTLCMLFVLKTESLVFADQRLSIVYLVIQKFKTFQSISETNILKIDAIHIRDQYTKDRCYSYQRLSKAYQRQISNKVENNNFA